MLAASAGCVGSLGGAASGGDGGSGDIGDTITIGVLAPVPSDNPIGASIATSAKLAAQQLNDDGGIAGANVEVIVKDTKEDPGVGRTKYRELTSGQNVAMTTGVFTSEVLLNIMDDIVRTGTIHMGAGAATPEASRMVDENYEEYKYFFRTGPINAHYLGANLIDFGIENFERMGWDRIAILVEDYKWTAPVSEVINNQVGELPTDVVATQRYASGTSDFTTIYDQIASQNVDGVLTAMAHTGTSAVVQWAKQQRPFGFGGIHVPMQIPSYYQSVDGASRYGFTQTSATKDSEITEKTVPYANAYNEQFDSFPVYTGYHTFDAVKQFASVVGEAGSLATDQVIGNLESSTFTGTIGDVEYYSKDQEYTHDLVYQQEDQTPVYFQWSEEDNGGVQQVFSPRSLQSGEYERPAWLR